MNVVVVESPAKAKTINKYLGKDYQVFASFGHVRDLPAKNGSVDPDKDFAMIYEVDDDAKKHMSAIGKAVKDSEALYLATDPDREGEAISWHVLEALKASRALPKDTKVFRVTFDEITKNAVQTAFANPRDIDMNLVNAQQARRALDYLVGFTLSPVLWRKLPGSKSAGRVQSVALRLICERDEEIEKFVSQEYWDIKAELQAEAGIVNARLVEYNGEKLEKFSIVKDAQANDIVAALKQKQYKVTAIEAKEVRRYPAPPFTTSTLQQEAARKLGFGAKRTMQVAQKLYEDGLITYMRTDGVTVSQDAIGAARDYIGKTFGNGYVPAAPRVYKTKSKNAQEAHEAVRPTDVTRTPQSSGLSDEQFKLYELIWKRLLASQMENAVFDQTTADIAAHDGKAMLRATGTVQKFDGFLKLYQEGRDDEEEDAESRLPPLKQDEPLAVKDIIPAQHFTEPPPRFTEASLVKKLEELGIGRPSTYASIISVLQDRGYVTLDKKRFIAESLGRLVNAFLVSFFEKYVEYGFTASLEDKLDDVSAGEIDWKSVLRDFWDDFIVKIEDSKKLKIEQVLDALNLLLADFVFGAPKDGKDPRQCPACATGKLGIRVGKFGPYISCSNYPECNHKAQIKQSGTSGGAAQDDNVLGLPKTLGNDPATSEAIALKKGPYGVYVQLGEGKKPKRAGLPKAMKAEDVTLEIALALLSLPREVGLHPDTGKPIVANNGRFGPYLLHDGKFTTLPPDEDVLTVGINRAVDIIATAPKKGGRAAPAPLKTLGNHPEDNKPVVIMSGKYGNYAKHNKTNATLPKDTDVESYTLEQAIELLAARAAAPKKKFSRKKKA